MSTRRHQRGGWAGTLPKGPNGRNLCRRCSEEVPRGRRTFCSEACIHEWKLRTDAAYLRQETFKRDLGVCAVCALDTKTERSRDERQSWHRRCSGTGHLWQADHIKPVIEGGGECGLENIRTLCTACHRAETAALAKRRAQARRESKPLPLIDYMIV